MTAPRPTGERLALIYGYSLPEGEDPIEGKRVEIDAGGALPVEAIDGDELVALAQLGAEAAQAQARAAAQEREHHGGLRARV